MPTDNTTATRQHSHEAGLTRNMLARLFCFVRQDPKQYWNARANQPGMFPVMWRNPTYNALADEDQWRMIADRLPTRRGHVLDLGCGIGRMTERLASHFREYTGVDIEGMINQAARQHPALSGRFVASDVNSYRFPEGTFDLVLSMACISHACSIADLPKIFRQIAASLAPDGRLIMIDPLHRHPLLARYLKLKPKQVADIAAQNGLKLEERRSVHCWSFRLILARAACSSFPRFTATGYRLGEIVLRLAPKSLGDYALLVFKRDDARTP